MALQLVERVAAVSHKTPCSKGQNTPLTRQINAIALTKVVFRGCRVACNRVLVAIEWVLVFC